MNFEQMIMQDGFMAVNFDLWLLLVNYKIPSIFISSKTINETRFNFTEFVCYKEPNVTKYVFILVPAMYARDLRDPKLLPKYKLIIDDNENINIDIDVLEPKKCLNAINIAIDNYILVEEYLDFIFEKDITTNYKRKQKGIRKPIEFEIVSKEEPKLTEGEENIYIEVKPKVRKLKAIKLKSKIILEKSEQIIPVKKRKTKKIIVNPPGKTGKKTKKNKEFVVDLPDQGIYP
jgi:hypothetical protein